MKSDDFKRNVLIEDEKGLYLVHEEKRSGRHIFCSIGLPPEWEAKLRPLMAEAKSAVESEFSKLER